MDETEKKLFKGCGRQITPIESCGDTKEPEFPFDMCEVCEAKIIQHRETKKNTLRPLGEYINTIEDRDDFKDLKPLGVITLILMEIERRTDALVSGGDDERN